MFSVLNQIGVGYAQEPKAFYNDELKENLEIWRLRQKQLTEEEKKELDKYTERMSEARLKEQKAQTDVTDAKKKLEKFLSEEDERLEKERLKLQEKIDRAQKKVERAQEALAKEQQTLETLKASFENDLAKAQTIIDKQQEKLKEEIRKNQERLKKAQENKHAITKQITEFEKVIEKKFR